MRPDDIMVGAHYGRLSPTTQRSMVRHVRAIFNGTVLYTVASDQPYQQPTYKNCSLKTFARWAEWLEPAEEGFSFDNRRILFLDDCRTVCARLGEDYSRDMDRDRQAQIWHAAGSKFSMDRGRIYMDDDIVIVTNHANGAMRIEKRDNRNPVVYVDENGKPYRFHGEYAELLDHVWLLLNP